MGDVSTWHAQAVEQLSLFFERDPDVLAIVLCGSLVDPDVREDIWSDVDAKVIVVDHAVERYYWSTAWLAPFGQLIGADRHDDGLTKTLRVCLEGFQRFDLSFIAQSTLRSPVLWGHNPFHPVHVVVWSRLPDLETQIASLQIPIEYREQPDREIERMIDAFWFKAAAAIGKVARNDLLIGMHLALDLFQDCLVLQMMLRDREKRTTIHRGGGWGNEITEQFVWNDTHAAGEAILDLIRLSCEIFDPLAARVLPGYSKRSSSLFSSIEAAIQIRAARAEAEDAVD